MFGDSGARGTHQIGQVPVAEGYQQERTARFYDSEARTQLKKGKHETLANAEAQEAEAPRIPLHQIVFVKSSQSRLRYRPCDDIKSVPVQIAESAITVGLALKIPAADHERRKLGNRTRCK